MASNLLAARHVQHAEGVAAARLLAISSWAASGDDVRLLPAGHLLF
jgi:hypothetical protein